ncbi:ParA family protein [Candidatus Poriferisodalis sp.]|uniref:ParA family protein n=1 Tax=Candidatus Poriferisodalis sp. TaxID=3101277 RepID=UPI003B02BCE6
MTTVAFFNNKGGVGKTSLVYHLAWMYAQLGVTVIAADLDPQANLTIMFVDEEEIDDLWSSTQPRKTVYGALKPQLDGTGDVNIPETHEADTDLYLVPGDLKLSVAEDEFSSQWPSCLDGKMRAFRVISAFGRMLHMARKAVGAQLVLVDVGPNLGAINRAALIAADYVVVPLAPDLYSLQGLRNLGPTLRDWRKDWSQRLEKANTTDELNELKLPSGQMTPIGYVVQQHAVRLDRPVKAYARWTDAIPAEYRTAILSQHDARGTRLVEEDTHCLGLLKNYRSLMPYAQDARKPMFLLKPADGAVGGHMNAVKGCHQDYRNLACAIAERVDVRCPQRD